MLAIKTNTVYSNFRHKLILVFIIGLTLPLQHKTPIFK